MVVAELQRSQITKLMAAGFKAQDRMIFIVEFHNSACSKCHLVSERGRGQVGGGAVGGRGGGSE